MVSSREGRFRDVRFTHTRIYTQICLCTRWHISRWKPQLSSSLALSCCPSKQTDAGCEQLHHLHQKQYSFSTLRYHQVGHTAIHMKTWWLDECNKCMENLIITRPTVHDFLFLNINYSLLEGTFPPQWQLNRSRAVTTIQRRTPSAPSFVWGTCWTTLGRPSLIWQKRSDPLSAQNWLHSLGNYTPSDIFVTCMGMWGGLHWH